MIKVNIENELRTQREAAIESPQLSEAKLLLEGTANEERTLLKEAGLDSNFAEIEKEVGINLERNKFETNLTTKFHTEEEIKAICVKYKLRFLPSGRFNGVIDPVLGAKLVRFFKEKKIDGASHEANSNLFILAPAKAFNFDKIRKPEPVDPILFYRVRTNEGNMYTMVHKWGNDFSIKRRALGVMYESETSFFITSVVIRTILFSFLFAIIGINPFNWITLLLSTGLGFVSFFCYWLYFFGDDNDWLKKCYEQKISTYNWDSTEEYVN